MTAAALVVVTVATGAAWLVDRAVGARLHPRVRSGLWLVVLCRILLPSEVLSAVTPDGWRWSGEAGLAPALTSGWTAGASPGTADWAPWLEIIWLTGALTLVTGWWVAWRRATRRLLPAPAEVTSAIERVTGPALEALGVRLPRLAIDPTGRTPYVTGLVRPRLVLPADWHTWSPGTLEHAVGHELLHVRRRDLWVEGLWLAATACYWFHPLVFLARRRAHLVRELACDADAFRLFGPVYRRTMRDVIGRHVLGVAPTGVVRHAWGPAVMRLKALDRWSQPRSQRARLAGAVGLSGLALALAAFQPAPDAGASRPTIAELVDPVARQARGLGSLHLRYAIASRAAAAEPAPD